MQCLCVSHNFILPSIFCTWFILGHGNGGSTQFPFFNIMCTIYFVFTVITQVTDKTTRDSPAPVDLYKLFKIKQCGRYERDLNSLQGHCDRNCSRIGQPAEKFSKQKSLFNSTTCYLLEQAACGRSRVVLMVSFPEASGASSGKIHLQETPPEKAPHTTP